MGYIRQTDTAYNIDIDKIQADANKNLTTLTLSKSIKFKEKRKKYAKKYAKTTLTESKVLPLTESKVLTLTEGKSNNNNNNGQASAPNGAEASLINKIKTPDLGVVGVASAACPSGQPSHTTTQPQLNGKDLKSKSFNITSNQEITNNTSKPKTIDNTSSQVLKDQNLKQGSVVYSSKQGLESNDLKLVLTKSDDFRFLYEHTFSEMDISKYTNAEIAKAVKAKMDNNPIEGIDKKIYFFFMRLVAHSLKIEGSELKIVFENLCHDKPKYIDKLKDEITNT